jgi:predicted nuclease with TOPRIM domain
MEYELFNGYDILINGYENKIKEKDLIINNLIINNFKKEKDTLYDDVINKSSLLNKHETRINDLEKENNFLKEQIKKFENLIEDNKRQSDSLTQI